MTQSLPTNSGAFLVCISKQRHRTETEKMPSRRRTPGKIATCLQLCKYLVVLPSLEAEELRKHTSECVICMWPAVLRISCLAQVHLVPILRTMAGRRQVLGLSLFLLYCQFTRATAKEEASNCVDALPKRTLANILWGCISTTIICAWAAVHPNIPPRESPLKKTLRRLDLMFCTIVAPEILPAWALNQLLAAMAVKDVYNRGKGYEEDRCGIWATVNRLVTLREITDVVNKAWTLRHGHFLVMGGFHLIEPPEGSDAPTTSVLKAVAEAERATVAETPDLTTTNANAEKGTEKKPLPEGGRVTILTLEMLRELIKDPEFDVPITEDDITDKAKGDALSKFIFILQTSWFILQCIARHVQGLDITQLELTTLALASLNAITFILWWHKPLGAQTPVRVYLRRKLTDEERNAGRNPDNEPLRSQLIPLVRRQLPLRLAEVRKIILCQYEECSIFMFKLILLPLLILRLLLTPFFIFVFIFVATVADLIGSSSLPADTTHVSTFYVPKHEHDSSDPQFIILVILGSIFGGVHCAGWNLAFPSYKERILWRVASLAVTVIPVGASVITFILVYLPTLAFAILRGIANIFGVTSKFQGKGQTKLAGNAGSSIFLLTFTVMYVAARLALLGQALALLRSQPPGAFITVDWTKFYPHV